KEYAGKVPKTMEEMLKLKGVARKTANIVLGNAYGILEGIAVDTHVMRLSQRLGLSKSKNPAKIEQDLMKIIPKEKWLDITYQLIEHGRAICEAKKPKCDKCQLNKVCPSAFNFKHFK
ncbi:MAG: endonuclease III, partial [Candidatus Woesearchaeota archaeon]